MARVAAGAVGARGAVGAVGKSKARKPASSFPRPAPEPVSVKPKPEYEAKDLPDWHDAQFQGKLDDLKVLGDEVTELTREKKEIEAQIEAKRLEAKAIMEDVNKKESWSVRDEDWTACYIKPNPKKSLIKELLIQQGVTWKQIQKATRETPVTPFVTFQAKKGAPDGGHRNSDDE